MIVQTSAPVTLLGGHKSSLKTLSEALSLAPFFVAADGGGDRALAHGHMPQAVIGDMDSLSKRARARIPAQRIHQVAEQDSTDFVKALRNIDAPYILALGFLGGRLDHSLAALQALVRHEGPPCVLIGKRDVVVTGRHLRFAAPPGLRVSLFPMARITGQSTGLKWPIDGLVFEPMSQIGVSNQATGPVELQFDAQGMLVITPRVALTAMLGALGVR